MDKGSEQSVVTGVEQVDSCSSTGNSPGSGYLQLSKQPASRMNFDNSSMLELPLQSHTHDMSCDSTNNSSAVVTQDLVIECVERLNVDQRNLSRPHSYGDNKNVDVSVVVSCDKSMSAGRDSSERHNKNNACDGNVEHGVGSKHNNLLGKEMPADPQDCSVETTGQNSEQVTENSVEGKMDYEKQARNVSGEVKVTFHAGEDDDSNLSDTDTGVAVKTRRLNTDTEIQEEKSNTNPFLQQLRQRVHGSGSDLESLGDSSEDGLTIGESQEICDCDECLLGEGTVQKQKTEAPLKKQSSWKKIRNMVHWSPFIQQFKRRKYPWIQLAGHQGNFQAGEAGAILKKYDKREYQSFNKLMKDVLRPYVPEYRGEVEKNGNCYIQLQDLLCEFEAPCVMDIKMGCRTYLEEELTKAREKPTLREDMYQKMIEVDPSAPTDEENEQKAITKPRYMQWRDEMSSSVTMGFRIEGIRKSDGAQVKNFKTTKDKASVKKCLKQFVEENPAIINKYLRRLKAIQVTQESSPFFQSHEVIGSSLLFVHDKCGQASIWMIDFGKTVPLPDNVKVTHRRQWVEGNHEDGYLRGIDSLIEIFEELCKENNTADSEQESVIQTTESSEVIVIQNCESSDSPIVNNTLNNRRTVRDDRANVSSSRLQTNESSNC